MVQLASWLTAALAAMGWVVHNGPCSSCAAVLVADGTTIPLDRKTTTSQFSTLAKVVSTTSSTGASSTSSAKATPTILSAYQSYVYNGCYTDQSRYLPLSAKARRSSSMTVESCLTFCNGFAFAGVEDGQECFCGSSINTASQKTSDSSCSATCTGNKLEYVCVLTPNSVM